MRPLQLLVAAVISAPAALVLSQSSPSAQFTNPVLWEDLADLDVFRVGDAYYYSASTMHYSPGAPVLRSYDLVNWQFIGHSVPTLNFGSAAKYNLTSGARAYVNGIWASSMRYRRANDVWYWYGCIEFGRTYVYSSRGDPAGPWTQLGSIGTCFYDAGLLVDDNDKMYVAYGRGTISVAELSADGLSVVRTQQVMTDSGGSIEGARFYKIGGRYYIWLTRPADGQLVLRADSPFGPYTRRTVLDRMPSPVPNSGTPHQGGIVDTPSGEWWYMAFLDAYPGGRIPVLAPLVWEDGWPRIVTDAGGWGKTYRSPVPSPSKQVVPAGPYKDNFSGARLGHEWEWNHNPDTTAFLLDGKGLTLRTASVTTDLYAARNTLTHRILGPKSSATFRLDVAGMAVGDVAGAAVFRDESAYIGVRKTGPNSFELVAVHGIIASEAQKWQTTNSGTVRATTALPGLGSAGGGDIWLRVVADVTATFGRAGNQNPVTFQYSTDGRTFTTLGPSFALHNRWQYFMAFRFAVFNYATRALGGSVLVKEFELKRES